MLLWLVLACKPSVEAPLSLNEAILASLVDFDEPDEVLAPAMRRFEEQMYRNIPVGAADAVSRSVDVAPLAEADVSAVSPRPTERDPADCLKVGVAWSSPFDLEQHAALPLLADQTPLEPSSPDHYDRAFVAGEDCWGDRACALLRTEQELTKVYTFGIIPPITYFMFKDFRWLNLNEGTDLEPRWTYLARSWSREPASTENGNNTIWQSYTVEVWFPGDGQGFLWGDEVAPSQDHVDSAVGGTTRMLVLWTETEFAISDDPDTQVGTIRWGIDQNMKAHDDFLEEQP